MLRMVTFPRKIGNLNLKRSHHLNFEDINILINSEMINIIFDDPDKLLIIFNKSSQKSGRASCPYSAIFPREPYRTWLYTVWSIVQFSRVH